MVDPELLALLRCPITYLPLSLADARVLGQLNRLVEQRKLTSRLHQALEISMDGALLNDDRSWALPIHGGIPNLNPDDALDLSGLDIQYLEE